MTASINASTSSGVVVTSDTSGDIAVQSNGTTKFTVASTGAYGQIVSGTPVTCTTQTAVDFTNIPSWVKRITIMFSNLSLNGTSTPQIQIGTSGGIQTSGYGGCTWQQLNTQITYTSAFLLNVVGNASYIIDGTCTLNLQDSATGTWTFSFTAGNRGGAVIAGGGSKVLSGTLDRVRINTTNGTDTLDSGLLNILYEG